MAVLEKFQRTETHLGYSGGRSRPEAGVFEVAKKGYEKRMRAYG